MNRRPFLYTLALSLITAALFHSNAFAQNSNEDQPTLEQIEQAAQPPKLESNVFDTGAIVRRKLLYRSARFEAVPFLGLTVNDAFQRNIMPGINLNYHITNDIGISATFAYGILQWHTSLYDNLIKELKKSPQGQAALGNIDFTQLQFFADLGLSYVPFFGKFDLFRTVTVNWDFHLVAGVTVIMQQAQNGASQKLNDTSILAGIKPGGLLQLGLRFYLNDFLSLNFDIRNLIYASSDSTVNNLSNSKITDRVFLSLGLGFFFPTDVKVSW